MSHSYQDYEYEIEKQLSVEEHKAIKDWSLRGYYYYVIFSYEHKFRFVLATRGKYPQGRKYLGKQLKFIPIDPYANKDANGNPTNRIFFSTHTGSRGEEYVDITQGVDGSSFASLFLKVKKKSDGTYEVTNKHMIHDKKIAVDRKDWFLHEIKKKNISNLSKKIIKDIVKDTRIDPRMMKILKTQFFEEEENDYMHVNSHAFVLTQGGTGKSSTLGVNGIVKQKNSDAGIFGYFNTSANAWISGAVSQTQKTIVIDEINEILNSTTAKGEDFITSINSALENGTYSYGKAGGRQITFGNQFIICGNISESFNFESFIQGIATNTETFGRRIAYFIYDNNLVFEKGSKRRPTKQSFEAKLVSAYCSYIWRFFVEKKKFIEKTFNKQRIVEIEKKYTSEIKKMCDIDEFQDNEGTKKFMDSFLGTSLGSRLKNMALKLAIFNNLNDFIECQNLNDERHQKVYESFALEYELLCEDLRISIKNIIKDFQFATKVDYTHATLEKNHKSLSKAEKLVLDKIFENDIYFDKRILKYDDMKNVESMKYTIRNWKRGIGTRKNFKNISYFGVLPVVRGDSIQFVIQNPTQYEKSRDLFSKGVSQIDLTQDEQDLPIKEDKRVSVEILDELEESDI